MKQPSRSPFNNAGVVRKHCFRVCSLRHCALWSLELRTQTVPPPASLVEVTCTPCPCLLYREHGQCETGFAFYGTFLTFFRTFLGPPFTVIPCKSGTVMSVQAS